MAVTMRSEGGQELLREAKVMAQISPRPVIMVPASLPVPSSSLLQHVELWQIQHERRIMVLQRRRCGELE